MTMRPIGVFSFGTVDALVLKAVSANITGYLHLDTEISAVREYPEYAYDPRRFQYNAGVILKACESLSFDRYAKVIGILEVDLFVPILTHVFGEARQGGHCALVSLHRLKKNPDGTRAGTALFLERAAKVALHELGHLFNLTHCDNERCLMHFSGGVPDLDRASPYFCRYCSLFLRDGISSL